MPTRFAEPVRATSADHAACRALIRQGSKSFFAASLLLPAAVREPALALYAFCRLADDLVDVGAEADPLTRLRARLARVYEGRPSAVAADRAFADVVSCYAIPRALPEALLEGFQWDSEGRRYKTESELNAYAARVAGSVGAMMACLMRTRAPDLVARACDLGVAMQLTNIARDVGEDARAGRLYLPLSWMQEADIDPERWLRRPVFSPRLAKVVERLLLTADELYERASLGIGSLPRDCRRGIYAARFLYAEIGHELRRQGLDSVSRRAVVPLARKATLVARALRAADEPGPAAAPAVLEEARFLIDAVVAEPLGAAEPAAARANLEDRVEWLVNLFERLERRDRQAAYALTERPSQRGAL